VLKTCKVSYRDGENITHSVEVTASSLYEAAVLAMKAFDIADWADQPRAFLQISVTAPVVKHEVSVEKLTTWLRCAGTPKEQMLKSRLREILGWSD